jgi:magnesium chelatase family protein
MRVHSFFIVDTTADLITIEYSSRFQIPGFQILGLPAPEIQEARERITSSFQSSGFEFPKKKILVNLAPASVKKSGTGHDLAIALKILSETFDFDWPPHALAWGELGLDGAVRSAGKIAHLVELLITRFPMDSDSILLLSPLDHAEFWRLIQWRGQQGLPNPTRCRTYSITNLKDLPKSLQFGPSSLNQEPQSSPPALSEESHAPLLPLPGMQERIVKIGSIGRHHVLILGPKGVGKSNSFEWFKHLTASAPPLLQWERALFQESRGESPRFDSPLRHVHAQVKPPHLLGSLASSGYRAGELSLSHGGILFADEFMEWPRDSKECLREPLQTKRLHLTRVKGTVEAKCDVQLIASGNLCQCGGFPARMRAYGYSSKLKCRCSEPEIRSYLQKLSGPILDRIDLIAVFTEAPTPSSTPSRPFSEIKSEIERARAFSRARFKALPAEIPPQEIEKWVPFGSPISKILAELGSLRSRHKVIRVALSIQALEGASELREEHVLESRTYRFMDSMI